MYCTNCGTVNPERAESCHKCGRSLIGTADAQAPSAVDIALAARPPIGAYGSSKMSLMSRLIVASLALGLVLMVLMIIFLSPKGGMVSGQDRIGAPGFGGLGLSPAKSPTIMANDAARKTNALRLQTAVTQFYAQNDRYPVSISEIPLGMLGFDADPAVYHYSTLPGGGGFRIEVIMQGSNISGSHIVSEGDVTKYVYEGQ